MNTITITITNGPICLILQKMVATFHIPELQILLGLLKLNKYGRKAELLQRAQAALSRGTTRQIQEEIRELYRYRSLNWC